MRAPLAVTFFALSSAAYAGGCSGAPGGGGLMCPVDPQCYVVAPDGECSVDPNAACTSTGWQCSREGKLGSGCLPDGGIVAPAPDAGPPDSGADSDACTLDCYGDICSLPSFTITCNGVNDTTTCVQYNAVCVASPGGGPQYVCECVAVDPPHGGATGN